MDARCGTQINHHGPFGGFQERMCRIRDQGEPRHIDIHHRANLTLRLRHQLATRQNACVVNEHIEPPTRRLRKHGNSLFNRSAIFNLTVTGNGVLKIRLRQQRVTTSCIDIKQTYLITLTGKPPCDGKPNTLSSARDKCGLHNSPLVLSHDDYLFLFSHFGVRRSLTTPSVEHG